MAQIKETYRTLQLKLHGEIRKVEELDTSFTAKDGTTRESSCIMLKVDDDDEERLLLFDKELSRLSFYKRGMVGTFTIGAELEREFGAGNYRAKLLVLNFEEDK